MISSGKNLKNQDLWSWAVITSTPYPYCKILHKLVLNTFQGQRDKG